MSDPRGIKRYGIQELESLVASWNEPPFRAAQLLRWLYVDGAKSYGEMSNLPKSFRLRLEAEEPLAPPEVLDCRISADGTRKYLLRLADGHCIETVGIPDGARLTVCFSTQVGCALGCTFCTTGTVGLIRSLGPGEMVDQLTVVSQDMGARVTNAVAMGEGEPFTNYDATLAAFRIMNSPDGPRIGARHLTVSTCGLIRQINRFADEPEQFTLAVSLHSAVQATRDALMPALSAHPLAALRRSLFSYAEKTSRRPTFEVTLIKGVNDTPDEVSALIDFARGLLCHVNLIPLNRQAEVAGAVEEGGHSFVLERGSRQNPCFEPSPAARCREIASLLQKAGIECSVRQSRGSDIQGACGQLKGTMWRGGSNLSGSSRLS